MKRFFVTLAVFIMAGLLVGAVLFLVTVLGNDIPVVIGETTYEGLTASWLLFGGTVLLLGVVGLIAASVGAVSSGRRR